METLIIIAVAVVAAVALGWWLLANRPARRQPGWDDPRLIPDWPGFDRYEGSIRFTKHALEEMRKDGINVSCIPIVLANATTSPAKDGKTKYVGTAPDTREVTVVAKQEGKHLVIVTVYWDDANRRSYREG